MSREIVLISSCTSSKLQLGAAATAPAEALYTGQQHVRLMRGVEAYRHAGEPAGRLRFRILSALHGLLEPTEAVGSYNHSFSGLTAPEIRRQADNKSVPSAVNDVLRRPYALGLMLLADPYLRACDLTAATKLGGPLIAFCSPAAGSRLPTIAGLRVVTLTNAEARRFSCGMIALKGEARPATPLETG